MDPAPFKLVPFEDYEAIIFTNPKQLKDCIGEHASYKVNVFQSADKEFMIFRYFEAEDEDAVLPDHIWSRIFFGPSFGEGTQMLQHGLLSIPLCVINGANEDSVFEVQNDGIVAFEVNGDVKLGKALYLWMKEHSPEHIFRVLGEQIIEGYMGGLQGGDARKFLINTIEL